MRDPASAARSSAPSPAVSADRPRVAVLLALVALAALALPRPAVAQDGAPAEGSADAAAGPDVASPGDAPWRFAVGERAVYDVVVSLGSVPSPRPLGEASLEVEARDTVEGVGTYRTALEIEGGLPMVYRMDDRQVSWIAPDPIRSLRYEERLREGDYRRHRRYRLDQERSVYTRFDREDDGWREVSEEAEVPMPADALDEVSFLYFVRSLPLEPGETYRYERFFEADGNPVVLEVLRRERVRVPAGRFETVVVRPEIQTDGLFAQGGRARVWITDDDRRIIVKIESRMKVGRVDMQLRSYRAGDPGGGRRTLRPGPGFL